MKKRNPKLKKLKKLKRAVAATVTKRIVVAAMGTMVLGATAGVGCARE